MWCFSVAQCQSHGLSNVSRPSIDRRSACRWQFVTSVFRLPILRYAQKRRIPIVIVNEGQTRADDIATLKIGSHGMQRLVSAIDELSPSTEKKTA